MTVTKVDVGVPEDLRVDLAELKGRLTGVERGLDRQETSCERRSGEHVDQRVYDTERRAIREELATIRDRLTDLDARQRGAEKIAEDAIAAAEEKARIGDKALEDKFTTARRFVITTTVAVFAALLTAAGLVMLL